MAATMLLVGLVGLSLSEGPADAGAAGPAHAAAANVGDQIAAFAASQAGVAYCDGGGGINGPTNGGVVEAGCGVGAVGYDCMSLVQYAVFQATGIALPGDGSQPNGVGTIIPAQATIAADTAELLPGDAVYWGGSLDGFAHSGIYAGDGNVWDAIGVNQPVQTHTMTQLRADHTTTGPSGTGPRRRSPREDWSPRWSDWPPCRTGAATG